MYRGGHGGNGWIVKVFGRMENMFEMWDEAMEESWRRKMAGCFSSFVH